MEKYHVLLLMVLSACLHIGMIRSDSGQCFSKVGNRGMDVRCQKLCQTGPCPMFCICKTDYATDNCSELTFAPNNKMKINETVTPGTPIFSIDVSGQEEWTYTLGRGGAVDGLVWNGLSSYLKLTKTGSQYQMVVEVTPDLEDIYQHYGIKLIVLILSLTCKRRGLADEPHEIFLEIVPVNEYAPEFFGTPLSTTVPEDTPLEAEIFHLRDHTLDMDVNPSTNELAAYGMWAYLPNVRRDGRTYFEMRDIQKGIVLLQNPLNFEALEPLNGTRFFLNLSASDVHGRTSYTTLTVNIQDVDDLPPEFQHPGCPPVATKFKPCLVSYEAHVTPGFKGQITNIMPGLIKARDMDTLNYPIRYSLEQGPGESLENLQRFSINGTTGAIFLKEPIDQETKIFLVIVATEVSPAARSTQASLFVRVNENDYTNLGMLVSNEGNENNQESHDSNETSSTFLWLTIVLSNVLLIMIITVTLLVIKLKKRGDLRIHPSTNNNKANSATKEDKSEISRESNTGISDLSLPPRYTGNRNQQNSTAGTQRMQSTRDETFVENNRKIQTWKELSHSPIVPTKQSGTCTDRKNDRAPKEGHQSIPVAVSKLGRASAMKSVELRTTDHEANATVRTPACSQSKDSIYSDESNEIAANTRHERSDEVRNENRLDLKTTTNVSNPGKQTENYLKVVEESDNRPSSEESYEDGSVETALPAMVTLSRSHAQGGCDVLSIVPLERTTLVSDAESVNSPLCTNLTQTFSKKHHHESAKDEEGVNKNISEDISHRDQHKVVSEDVYIQQSTQSVPETQQVFMLDNKMEEIHDNLGHVEDSLRSETACQTEPQLIGNSVATTAGDKLCEIEIIRHKEDQVSLPRSQPSLDARPYTSSGVSGMMNDLDVEPRSRPFTSSSSPRKQKSRRNKRMQAVVNSIEIRHERDSGHNEHGVRDRRNQIVDGRHDIKEDAGEDQPMEKGHYQHQYSDSANESLQSREGQRSHDFDVEKQRQHEQGHTSRGTNTLSTRKKVYIDYTHCQPYMLLRQSRSRQQQHPQHEQFPDTSQRPQSNERRKDNSTRDSVENVNVGHSQRKSDKRSSKKRETERYDVMNAKIQEWLNNPE